MNALSIHQPYVSLIVDSASRIPAGVARKRVENRSWFRQSMLGQSLLLHATSNRSWCKKMNWPRELVESMTFGALVGVADVQEVIRIADGRILEIHLPPGRSVSSAQNWILKHEHASGEYCWVLNNVRRFPTPIPYKGAQGPFLVPNQIVADAIAASAPVMGVMGTFAIE